MGYRGKLVEQDRARALRAKSWTLQEIADELGVAKSSVSLWVRDIAFTPRAREPGAAHARLPGPNALARRKQEEIAAERRLGGERIGTLSDRDLLIAGAALYAGEGAKGDGCVKLANSDPRMIELFCRWLRRFFAPDEARLRAHLYLHQGLDADAAIAHWSTVTAIPAGQFIKPYRAVADHSRRHSKHENGCVSVSYSCSRTHRTIMGLVEGTLAARHGNNAHSLP